MAKLTATLLAIALAGTAAAQPVAEPQAAPTASASQGQAVYVMTNNPNGNAVLSLPIASNGKLSYSRSTSTGGLGGAVVSSGPGIDTLASQGALEVLGSNLFAVNAGSNTLSMFSINKNNPTQLTLVGTPISTLGDFPNSVAVSNANPNLVCVSNTGTRSGIACFQVTANGLQQTDGKLHALPLSPKQSNPPTGPANTVSEPFFSADGTHLYVTVKGGTSGNPNGYFGSFPVSSSAITGSLTQSNPAGTELLFGSIALADGLVFTTDPSFGAAVLNVSSAGVAKTVARYSIPNQGATCWAVVSPATGLGYTIDDGVNQITAFNPRTLAYKGVTALPNNNTPNIQVKASGSLLYVLSHGNSTTAAHVVALQTTGSNGGVSQLQNFQLTQATDVVDGLAVYPSDYVAS